MSTENLSGLIISVTRRLFIALVALSSIALAAAILTPESRHIVIVVVMASGLIGGFVGLQRRLKELTIVDLELIANSWIYTCLSPLVGGLLALLLYFLFLSDLVSGDIFPRFIANENTEEIIGFVSIFQQHGNGYKDYAKLIFWCFLAGFSEHFVTDVISRFEGAAAKTLP